MNGNAVKRWADCNPKPAWGKFDDRTGGFHRLEHHSADVAACFEALLGDPVLRSRFETAVGAGDFSRLTEARLTFLAYLHDLGKLNVGFQFDVLGGHHGAPRKANHVKAAYWACQRLDVINALSIPDLARWGAEAVEDLIRAALAHHGSPLREPNPPRGRDDVWRPYGDYDPIKAARLLARRGREWFPDAFGDGPNLRVTPELVHLFAGLLAIADQLGSNRAYFPHEPAATSEYIRRARRQAFEAIRASGFSREGWADEAHAADFDSPEDYRRVFGFERPRPLQDEVACASVDAPLLILESETGSGKTEAALIRFCKLWRAGRVDGLYFALPTRTAAVQIHRRVHEALRRVFPEHARIETVLALPGYLRVGETEGKRVGRFEVEWRDNPDEAEIQARWAAESARKFLSATAAVGTVDQAMLAALQVKWAHFRGASIARSLLVVDEVHASDVYMTEVLRRVLRDHLAVGGHALLMSATLGSAARDRLIKNDTSRCAIRSVAVAKSDPYPALTLAERDQTGLTRGFDYTGYQKRVRLIEAPMLRSPTRIAARALAEARHGGRVLVVLNTVGQAQAVFAELRRQGGDLCLQLQGGPAVHHSRFAVEDRRRLDRAVERTLGDGRERGGCVVVGTQTLEQSLDIDADVLITHLCPMDVLLQRIGRLHRHPSTVRPKAFGEPRCIVIVPEEGLETALSGGLLAYGLGLSRTGGIYRDVTVLELTRRLIAEWGTWRIPEDNRELVESATHPEACRALEEKLGGAWRERSSEVDGRAAAEMQVAKRHMLDRQESFGELVFVDRDEQVRTRLGEDGPRVRLAEPVVGPFGRPVRSFNLPAHLFRGDRPTTTDLESARLRPTADVLRLRVGDRVFRYDRGGISQEA